jgi:hypothetical protein
VTSDSKLLSVKVWMFSDAMAVGIASVRNEFGSRSTSGVGRSDGSRRFDQ